MQKHLLLINLKELHLELKKATDINIQFSKCCEFQPKWCIPVGSTSGAHSLCICEYHQNAKHIFFVIPGVTDYTEIIRMVVCDIENRDYIKFVGKLPISWHAEKLSDKTTKFGEIDNHNVKFKQWKKEEKNKTNLLSLEMSVEDFIEVCRQIELIREHNSLQNRRLIF